MAIAASYLWDELLDVRATLFDLKILLGLSDTDCLGVLFSAIEVKQHFTEERHPLEPPCWTQ